MTSLSRCSARSELTRFPVRVSENETFVDLDESAFNRDYEKVWKPQTVNVVMSEDPDHFTGDHDHFSMGCGEVWFDKTKEAIQNYWVRYLRV